MPEDAEISALVQKAKEGDEASLAQLFARYKQQLQRIIEFRMDQKLRGRFGASDVLQEAFIDLARKIQNFDPNKMSFFVWLRLVTNEKIINLYNEHVNVQKRDVRREQNLSADAAKPYSLAKHIIDRCSSISGKAIKAERANQIQAILSEMHPDEREVIALRIFEGLSNGETAEILGLTKQTASKRFIRVIGKLKHEFKDIPGLLSGDR